jgi:hypothetical protein
MNSKAKETHLTLVAAGKRPGEHEWKPGADVQSVWKKFGWTPPSRSAVDYSKGSSPVKPPVLRIMRG